MSRTSEPLWTHSLTPVVTSDPLDAEVGSAWDLVVIGEASSGVCAALTARESGRTVCVIDAGDVGPGVSGQATVKVTSGPRFAPDGSAPHGPASQPLSNEAPTGKDT